MRTALAIAGSDPTGGAGLQLDVQVFQRFGLHGAAVPTALTVQDTERVHQVLPVFPTIVLEQLRAVLHDFEPAVVKLGMLASDDVLRNVALGLEAVPAHVPIVVDPVLLSSSGTPLLERRAWRGLVSLLGRARIVTPNLHELEALSEQPVDRKRDIEAAARALLEKTGAGAVLAKGGHRERDADDLLVTAGDAGGEPTLEWLEGERIEGGPVHGTGCALASAIAAGLALGHPLDAAVRSARAFVRAGIAAAAPVGKGARLLSLGEGAG